MAKANKRQDGKIQCLVKDDSIVLKTEYIKFPGYRNSPILDRRVTRDILINTFISLREIFTAAYVKSIKIEATQMMSDF